MVWEEVLGIILLVLAVIFRVIVHFADKNIRMKYHDQRVGVRTKWWRR